jgi:hypothetical protein
LAIALTTKLTAMQNTEITTTILLKALDLELKELLMQDLQQYRSKQQAA